MQVSVLVDIHTQSLCGRRTYNNKVIIMSMISPENNEPLRRRGHNSNVIGENSIDGSSIATTINSPQHTMLQRADKSGGVVGGTSTEKQSITTLIRERQMGSVSPDNNNIDKGGDGAVDNNNTMSISKSITVSNLMVVTPISSTTKTQTAEATLISPGSNSCSTHKSKLNQYETPQKEIISSPSTGVTPFLNSSSSNNNNRHQYIPKYSPLSPSTTQYISQYSPYKLSMDILDNKLNSIMDMDDRLNDKIDRLEEVVGDDSFDNSFNGLGNDNSPDSLCGGKKDRDSATVDGLSSDDSTTESPLRDDLNNGDLRSDTPDSTCSSNNSHISTIENSIDNSSTSSQEIEFHTPNTSNNRSTNQSTTAARTVYHTGKECLTKTSSKVVNNKEDGSGEYDADLCQRILDTARRKSISAAASSLDSSNTNNSINSGEEDEECYEEEMNDTFDSSCTLSPIHLRKVLWKEGTTTPRRRRQSGDGMKRKGNRLLCTSSPASQKVSEQDHNSPSQLQQIRAQSDVHVTAPQQQQHNSPSQIQQALLTKEMEVNELRVLLENRDVALLELQSILVSRDDEIKELSSTVKSSEEEYKIKLDGVESKHVEEIKCLTNQLKETHEAQLEVIQSSHKKEVECIRTEIEAQQAVATDKAVEVEKAQHEEEMNQISTKYSSEIECLRADLDTAESTCVKLMTELEKMQSDHNQVVKDSDERITLLQTSMNDMNSAFEKERSMFVHQQELLKEDVATKVKENDELLAQQKKELAAFCNEADMHITELTQLQSQLTAVIVAKELAEENNQALTKSCDDKTKELSVISSEKNSLVTQLQELEARNIMLVEKITSIEEERDVAISNSIKNEERIVQLESRAESATVELSKILQQRDDLLLNQQDLEDKISNQESAHELLVSSFDSHKLHAHSLSEELSALRLENEVLAKDNDDKAQDLKSKEDEISSLIDKFNTAEDQLCNLNEQLSNITNEKVEANELVSQANEGRRILLDEKASVEEERDALSSEVSSLKDQISKSIAEKDEARLQIDDHSNRIQELEQELASKEVELRNNSEACVSRDRFRLLSAKLAVNVLQLKMQKKKTLEEVHQLEEEKKQVMSNQQTDTQIELSEALKTNDELKTQMESLNVKVTEIESSLSSKDDNIQEYQVKMANDTELITSLQRQNEELSSQNTTLSNDLKSKEIDREDDNTLIDQLRLENEALKEAQLSQQVDKEAASTVKLQLKQTEESLVKLEASKLLVENHLEEVLHDRSHLSTEVDTMHDTISALEASKERLSVKLQDYKGKTVQLSTQVNTLENQAKSNEEHINHVETQLSARVMEVEALNKTLTSLEATLLGARNQMQSLDKQKTNMEDALSSLHLNMNDVMSERDELALQLEKAVKELERARAERNKLAAKIKDIPRVHNHHDEVHMHTIQSKPLVKTQSKTNPGDHSSQKDVSKLLKSACISEKKVNLVVDKIDNARTLIIQVEEERKLLNEEVFQLRASLEKSQRELSTAKKDNKKLSSQAVALRGAISQAKALLEKAEEEKINLALELKQAQETIKHPKLMNSSSSNKVNSSLANKDGINMIDELKEKYDSIRLSSINEISQYDVSFETTAKVTSKERYKVEKGSMFDLLKKTKTTGRKAKKYRKEKPAVT